jgi:predicted extracellular nuclease
VSVPRSTSLERGLVWLVAVVLALGAMVPLAARMPARAASSDLFISEYIEGSASNKAIEIYNGTDAEVSLTGAYTLELYTNGSPTVSQTMALSGTVADGDVYVIAHPLATSIILLQADATNGSVINFNGNDAVVLKHNGLVIDMFGTVGNDPGSDGWGTDPVTSTNHTLSRKPAVADGDVDGFLDPAGEWDVHPQDTFSFLGSHTVSDEELPTDPTGFGAADPNNVMVGNDTVLTVAVTPGENPTSTGVSVTADLGPIGGDAVQAFSDDGTTGGDETAGDLVFTHTATVQGVEPGDKVITATIEDDFRRTATTEIELSVFAAPNQIAEIQGASHRSPMEGDEALGVQGIVTAVSSTGFWMTDPTPDANPATSDGIFVFRGSAEVGDAVVVSGTVQEFRPGGSGTTNLTTTEISSPTVDVLSQDNDLPTTVIGVDVVPPTEIIEDDATTSVEAASAVFDPSTDGIDFWESLEGMRIEVRDAVAVGPTNGFGETAAISQLQDTAGVRTPRGGILVRNLDTGPESPGDYRSGDFNPERVILDDALMGYAKVNTGDEFATDPVGVLDYNFGNFKLLVTANAGRVDNHLAPEVAAAAGPQQLKVATFNVENLSPVDPQSKVNRLASQIVDNLRSPDLIAIEEIQDNNGTTNNGVVAADQSWQRLIDAIVAAGGPVYQFRQIDPENNADGGAPGGNIRVGFLFRTDRDLEFVDRPGGTATSVTGVAATPNAKGARLTQSPGRVLPDPDGQWANAFVDTRKSLAGEFRWRGETLFVIVKHVSSKGDDRPLFGRFQPPFRLTEYESGDPEDGWRHAQAQVINEFVDEVLAVDPKANVVVLGDINDFDFSETVGVLSGTLEAENPGPDMADGDGSGPTVASAEAAVLHTLFERLPANERYSYVFDGNSQVLDQILVSSSLFNLGASYDVVHVNAEFFEQASDHDPSVMTVAFQPRSAQPTSGSGSSRGVPRGG